MNDPDDAKLKAEIDAIMKRISNIMKRVEKLHPVKSNTSRQNED